MLFRSKPYTADDIKNLCLAAWKRIDRRACEACKHIQALDLSYAIFNYDMMEYSKEWQDGFGYLKNAIENGDAFDNLLDRGIITEYPY